MENNHESIQKGNPYRLTKEHIKRFENKNKKVYCKSLKSKNSKTVEINSNDSIFKVQRLWSEFSEKGYMKDIEDKFNRLVDNILDEKIKKFTAEQSRIIYDMYTLWERRIYHIDDFITNPNLNTKLHGINGDNYTVDEKEKIESLHMTVINENGEISNRDLIGTQIQLFILNSPYLKIEWWILKSNNQKIFMPSNPFMDNCDKSSTIIFPISPFYCLVPTNIFQIINDDDVNTLNNIMIKNSIFFYFSKDN